MTTLVNPPNWGGTLAKVAYLGASRVPADAREVVITIPGGHQSYFAFTCTPDWNSNGCFEYQSAPTTVTIVFPTPAPPGGGTIRWGIWK